MQIKTYTAPALYDLTLSESFSSLPNIPISTIRALSYLHNPRGEKEDIVMVMCFEEEEIVGYLGILPDFLWENELHQTKFGWMSCIWVDPKMRGRGVAKKLIQVAYEAWNGNLLLTEFTEEARTLYNKMGIFQDFTQKKGLRCFYKWDLQTILPKKKPQFQYIQTLLKLGDFLANKGYSLFLPNPNLTKESIHYEQITAIDSDLFAFISKHKKPETFHRSLSEWTWMRDFPWIEDGAKAQVEEKHYAFSVYSQRFETQWIKITKDNKIIGFMICTLRNQFMKIPYLYCDEAHIEAFAKSILHIMKAHNIATLIVYHPLICTFFEQNPRYFIYTKPANRDYLISKRFAEKIGEMKIVVQDGDGDCGFT